MAARDRAAKAGQAARAARSNPYIQRILEDAELRANVRTAVDSARGAYGRMSNGKGPAKALLDDKKLQQHLRKAAASLKDASAAIQEAPKKQRRKRRGGLGKALFVAIVGAGLALALSEDIRNKALDALFGKEEEFEYSSTTTTTPAPAAAPSPSASVPA